MTFEEAFAETGHQSKTTFWSDFSIADHFGIDAVIDTYNRSKYFVDNPEYWAELVVVLNWKVWNHYEKNPELAMVYQNLQEEAENFFYEAHRDDPDGLRIYYEITD